MEEADFETRRACGCCLSPNDLIDVTDDPINLITLCFSIQISNHYTPDKSLVFICNTCNDKLKDCYKFRRQILSSQTQLKKLCASTDSESGSDNEIFEYDYSIEENFSSHSENLIDANNSTTLSHSSNERKFSNLMSLKNNSETNVIHKENSHFNVKNVMFSNKGKFKRKEDILRMRTASQHKYSAKSLPYKLDKESLTCNICNETFEVHKMLQSHMPIHYTNFICDTCGKPFASKNCLYLHLKTHNQKKITCHICNKDFKSSSRANHMRTHSSNKKFFACPHCTERFVSYPLRLKHMEKNHNVDIYRYFCKFCPKKFHLSSNLTRHTQRCHFKLLNVTCAICDKGFYDTKELKEHIVVHTGEKNYKCDFCSKKFSKKWNLKVHQRSHTHNNVRKHKCSQCGKNFTQMGSLKVHMSNIHKS